MFVWGFFIGGGMYFDNLHVTSTGTHKQSYSGNNGLADSGTGRLGHVGGDEVLQLINYGVHCKGSINISIDMNMIKKSFFMEKIANFICLGSIYTVTFFFLHALEPER